VPAVDPVPVVGQVNELLNEPEPSVFIEAEPAEVGELQSVVPIPKVAVPLASGGQVAVVLVLSCTPVPDTVVDWPAGPDVGLIVIEGAAHAALTRVLACTGDAIPKRNPSNVNSSTAKNRISTMPVEPIFEKFSPVFICVHPRRTELI